MRNDDSLDIRYDDIERHETSFLKHPVKVKKVKKMKIKKRTDDEKELVK
jgi:hypothetical protein